MQRARKVMLELQHWLAVCLILLFVGRALAVELNEGNPSPQEYADHNLSPEYRLETVLASARESFEKKDYDTCLQHLSAIAAAPGFEVMPSIVKSTVWMYEVFANTELMRYSHAVSALEAYAALEGASANIVTEMVTKLQRRMFASISFDPANGFLRTRDMDDFVTQLELSDLANFEEDSDLGRLVQGIRGKTQITLSDSEEWAEMEAVFSKRSDPDVIRLLRELIVARIKARNFELPVKFLLHRDASLFLDELGDNPRTTLRDMLQVAITEPGMPEVPTTTTEGFVVGQKLAALVKRMKE